MGGPPTDGPQEGKTQRGETVKNFETEKRARHNLDTALTNLQFVEKELKHNLTMLGFTDAANGLPFVLRMVEDKIRKLTRYETVE